MTDQWRIDRGITPKVVHRCPTCGTEHKGKCRFMKSRHAKAQGTAEQTKLWLERRKYYQRMRHVQRIIREFCNEIDKARRAARRESGWRGMAQDQGATHLGADTAKATRNTLTRKRTCEDRT